jgi:hypothetical protein
MTTNNDCINAHKRQRYSDDPEFREQCCARTRAFREKNRDKINEEMREKRASDPEFREKDRARQLNRRRKRVYGITTEDYNRMLARQHGACAICKQRYGQKLCIDHCHATRKVRGLLCHRCNVGLGCYADDPSFLREAAAYLEAARDLPSPITHAESLASRCPSSPALGARHAGQAEGAPAGAVPLSPVLNARDEGQAKRTGPGAVPLSPTPGARDAGQAKRATPGAVPLSPAPDARDAGQAIASHSGPDLNGAASLPPAQSPSPGTRRHPKVDSFGEIAHRPPPPVPVNSPCCVWGAASAMGRDHCSPSG